MAKNDSSLKSFLMDKATYKKNPINANFELTPRCNMNCKMCYIRMSAEEQKALGEEKTCDEWINFGRECAENGMLFLLLTGGEPFLRKDFKDIYQGLKKLGLFISINSNGTLIDKSAVEWLKNDPPTSVNITLYGASRETYKSLCGYEDGFDKVLNAIDLLTEAKIPVVINVSLTKLNVHDLEKIIEIGRKRDLPVRVTSYMFPPVRKKDGQVNEEARFSAEECGDVRYRTLKAQLPKEQLDEFIERIKYSDYSILSNDECGRLQGNPMSCMAGRSSFWITWDGKMTPCGMITNPVSYPFDIGFKEAWTHIFKKVEEIRLPKKCVDCSVKELCRNCAAISIAEGEGDSTVQPKYLCDSTMRFIYNCKEH